MPLVPELERIRREAETASAEAGRLCDGLGEESLAWRPQTGRWSIAEHLLHLEMTTRTFLPVVDQSIAEARSKGLTSPGPFRLGLKGRLFVWYNEPPPMFRLPAPKALQPITQGAATEALPRFLQSQRLMLERLELANGLDIARARLASPFASYIRMSLFALFSVFTAHERRHLWHISNLRRQLAERAEAMPQC